MGTIRYTVMDEEILSENRNSVERDYVPDPLGSTLALLNSSQVQTDTFSYWPVKKKSVLISWCMLIFVITPILLCCYQLQRSRLNYALVSAIKHNDANSVFSLLARGADPNFPDLPPHRLSFREILYLSIGQPLRPVSVASTPLLLLVDKYRDSNGNFIGQPENTNIVKALLAAGADMNIQDKNGNTPLMLAINSNYLTTAKILLDNHADANTKNYENCTPLMLLLGANINEPSLAETVADRTTNLNFKDKDGRTALLYASQNGNLPIVRLLLSRGVDVNAQDNSGYTALILAALNNHSQVLELLLRFGANPNLRCCTGDTALSWARQENCTKSIAVLKHAGIKK